ncbi:MAG: hypothetical protein NVS9B2_00030 [Steroidobacteraceae bacterium]
MSLIARIEQTFRVPPPPVAPIVEAAYLRPDAQGDEGATEAFLGKTWKGLGTDLLLCQRSAMSMFTPRAHHYYFPAFVRVALELRSEAEEISDLIIYHLSLHYDSYWWERIRLFDGPQCDVIAEFVEVMSDEVHRESGEAIRALAALERARHGG